MDNKSDKITALWLVTGKKLDATRGIMSTEKGMVVRTGDTLIQIIPLNAVVAIECEYLDKEVLDKVFDG